jgi:hypothetical protein
VLVAGQLDPVNVILDDAPCDACVNAARCAAQHLACESFAAFVAGEPESRWQAAPRAPRAAIYARLYHGKAA